ncbi:hypothetical protein CTI12_AA485000 [Artemisia annua]|uniref:Protodermal factor 1 n=1 Tax=Artemisia annua TaxID=35608 RepID=A0A2U1LJA1_ARTAN|nr:hypothetical protein CTI12_AA485000 [Artemisia annua]
METPRRTQSTCFLIWGLVAALLSHNVFSTSSNLQDQKNFYFPPFDPSFGLSPPVAVTPPIVPSPPISYNTSPPPTYGSPPTHGSPPSHGTTPVHHPPSHGGGGHHHDRARHKYKEKIRISKGLTFWRNHPTIIWGIFGFFGPTIGSAFGVTTLPGTGAHLNLLQALQNTKPDGISALYREGTASLLNSMVNKNFPYSTSHVKDSFVAAIGSNKAAAAQARVFKLANEGHMKLRV